MAEYIIQDRKRIVDVRQELNVMSIVDRITEYRPKTGCNIETEWMIAASSRSTMELSLIHI